MLQKKSSDTDLWTSLYEDSESKLFKWIISNHNSYNNNNGYNVEKYSWSVSSKAKSKN